MAFRSVPRPSSPPGAKASTECPSYARDHRTSPEAKPSHHVQEPSMGTPARSPVAGKRSEDRDRPAPDTAALAQHTTDFSRPTPAHAGPSVERNPHAPERIAPSLETPLRRCRSDNRDGSAPRTHQNLIHTSKEQRPPVGHVQREPETSPIRGDANDTALPLACDRTAPKPTSSLRHPSQPRSPATARPPRRMETIGIQTDDPLLAKQVLSQLSYAPGQRARSLSDRKLTAPAVDDEAERVSWAREDLNLRPHAYQACAYHYPPTHAPTSNQLSY